MLEPKVISVKDEIFQSNNRCADQIRERLQKLGVTMVNVMASPGSGKTSFILRTIQEIGHQFKIAVVEGDIESKVDSLKMQKAGVEAIQINTNGSCHLDAVVVERALSTIASLEQNDLVFIENIGNLVCPAEFDIGEDIKLMITSVPEGDDKILKYPLMFSVADVIIINKTDYLPQDDFDLELLKERMHTLNPKVVIFEVSCRTGAGIKEWCSWLIQKIKRNGTAT